MAQRHISRQQEYVLEEAEQRHISVAYTDSNRNAGRKPRGRNTLPPPEDVLEARLTRHNSAHVGHINNQGKHLLIENLILLSILIASIYGLYRLTVYLLNQA